MFVCPSVYLCVCLTEIHTLEKGGAKNVLKSNFLSRKNRFKKILDDFFVNNFFTTIGKNILWQQVALCTNYLHFVKTSYKRKVKNIEKNITLF